MLVNSKHVTTRVQPSGTKLPKFKNSGLNQIVAQKENVLPQQEKSMAPQGKPQAVQGLEMEVLGTHLCVPPNPSERVSLQLQGDLLPGAAGFV